MKKQSFIRVSLLAFLAAITFGCPGPQINPTDGRTNPSARLVISNFSPSSGSMGDIIQIDGSGFSANPSQNVISFGKAAGIVTSASDKQLIVLVPYDAETSKLAVEVNGLSAVSADIFAVKHSPPVFRGGGSNEMENLSAEFARVSSTLLSAGSQSLIQHGHVWSSTQVEPIYDNSSRQQSDLGTVNDNWGATYKFTSYMVDLRPNTTYSVKPYVIVKGGGVTYGPSSHFTTPKSMSK